MMLRKQIFLGCLLWVASISCAPKLYLNKPEVTYYTIPASQQVDSSISNLLRGYKQGVDTMMNVVIGQAAVPLTKAAPESLIGNFMCDAMLNAAQKIQPQTKAAVMNYGGMRVDYIAPGPITIGKMYELMPFDNMLTIVEIPGSVLKTFCDHMAARKGWPVAGLSYVIRDGKAEDIRINGERINDHIVYSVAINDYMANGGDHCEFLTSLKKKNTSLFIRDILIEELKEKSRKGELLHPQISNRVSYAE